MAGHLTFTQLVGGTRNACGVTTTHAAYCWGWNFAGQLGDGTTELRVTPVAVVGPTP